MGLPASPPSATHESWNPLRGVHAQTFDARNKDLLTHWDACLANATPDSRFLTHGWYSAWLATYGSQPPWTGQGHVVVATTHAGQPVGLLPMAAARNRGLRFLALAGYVQPIRGLVVDAEAAEAAGAALASALLEGPFPCDLFRVGPLELDAPGHRAFLEGLRRHAHFVEVKALETPIVCHSLPADFETYQAKVMAPGLVKEVEYKVRRLRRDGDISIRHYHNPGGEEFEAVLRACQLVEGRSWLATADDARLRFATELDLQFWRLVASDGLPPDGGLDVWMLYFNNQPACYNLTLTAGGIRYGIAGQYDRDFHKYSIGSVLFSHVFEDACNSGVKAVHFGSGHLQYKERWGAVEEGECVEALVFPHCLKGRCLNALYKQLKRLRPSWVRPR